MAIYVDTAPTFSVTSAIGTRTINSTKAVLHCSNMGSSTRIYYWFRLYDSTAGIVLSGPVKLLVYDKYSGSETVTLAAGSKSITAPASTTTHTIYIQYGKGTNSSTREPSSWSNKATYTVSVPGKQNYSIVYYDYKGSTFYSTTGVEASNHTVYNPGTSIRGFDHWNTNSSDTGTSYAPGATRYVNGNLYFYAIGNPVPIIYIKVDGAWKEGILKIKYNGVWKDADTFYIKTNDSWKEAD